MTPTDTPAPPDAAAAPPAHSAASAAHPAARTVIEPPRGWEFVDVAELWRYRELLLFLAWRDVKVRYKQTVLGAAWAVLQPAMMMVVFTVFFGRLAGVATGDLPQPLFFLTGLLPWFFFSSAVSAASSSVVGSERLITKIYFPRLCVPFATVLASAVDFCVACGLLAAALLVYGVTPTWNLALFPAVALVIGGFAAGLGTLLAALNVTYRDVRYVIPFFIQIGMFATPTIYSRPSASDGELVGWLLVLNPMNGLVDAFRAATVGGPVPWGGLAAGAAVAAAALAAGCLYFRKVEDRFADII